MLLNSVLGNRAGGKRRKGVDLNVLESRIGEVLGDPVEAHKALTGAFSQWFSGPTWCKGRLHEGDYFEGLSESDAAFLQDTCYTGVPDELRLLIHKAIQQLPNREVNTTELR